MTNMQFCKAQVRAVKAKTDWSRRGQLPVCPLARSFCDRFTQAQNIGTDLARFPEARFVGNSQVGDPPPMMNCFTP
jgi:hypothetical protein